ncbi:MAG: hypothetical protein ACI9A7_000720, partial [Cyclobacteriaceae bacterium]
SKNHGMVDPLFFYRSSFSFLDWLVLGSVFCK